MGLPAERIVATLGGIVDGQNENLNCLLPPEFQESGVLHINDEGGNRMIEIKGVIDEVIIGTENDGLVIACGKRKSRVKLTAGEVEREGFQPMDAVTIVIERDATLFDTPKTDT